MTGAPPGHAFQVLGDQPYGDADDPFGFGALVEQLGGLILSSRVSTPFTLGIEASWGRGKSTLMGLLGQSLVARGRAQGIEVRTVPYNAWTAEGSDVLEGLVKSVLNAMDESILRRALRRKRLISAARIPVLIVASWLRVGELVDTAWDRLAVDARTRNQVNALVREAMDDWLAGQRSTTAPGVGRRLVVVFIDDLDRCSPENVLRVFEALKLYLDAPGFVFVIGYDEAAVASAVRDERELGAATAREFVEKIVQIVFRIPRPTDEQIADLLGRLLRESGTDGLFDEAARQLVIERNGRNPRRMKRFVNRFVVDYQLDESSRDLEPELLVKLLIIETYFADFARLFAEDQANPIREFLDYAAARNELRAGRFDPAGPGGGVFDAYGITIEPTDTALARLEAEVPEAFVALVRDDEFVSLIQSVADDEQQRLLDKVRRRRELGTAVADEALDPGVPLAAVKMAPGPPRGTARIVWVDDRPEGNAELVHQLVAAGHSVEQVQSLEELRAVLPRVAPDLVISSVTGDSRSTAWFDDLRALRADGAFDGPVVVYAARISSSRRLRADAVGAEIVSTPRELIEAVDRLAPPAPATAAAPAARPA